MYNKYHLSRHVCAKGHTHSSKKEVERCGELTSLLRKGAITNLQIQREFILIPHEISYIADFVYTKGGKTIVEDTKGYKTKDDVVKRKMFKDMYCKSGDMIFKEVIS